MQRSIGSRAVFMKSSELIPIRRGRLEREFLPAALEIIETPPSPAGRGLALALAAFFCVALAWAWIGRVDIVASAPGHVVPAGEVKLVQPLEAGIVKAIHAQDGDHVRRGQVLIEFDPTSAGADRDRFAQGLVQTRLTLARLRALAGELEAGGRAIEFAPPAGADPRDVATARAATEAEAAEQAAKLDALDQQVEEKRAEAGEIAATLEKLRATLPVLEQKEALRKQLLDIQYGNRFAYLDAEQQAIEARHEIEVQSRRAGEVAAAGAALGRQRDQTRAEYARKVLTDLADAQQKESELAQELVKAERKSAETALTAPIDGTVQQLAIHTVGGVATPAEKLMVIVPDNEPLLVEAMVANRDVGFVHAGQAVEVKVETFSFTRYGLLHGHVVDVSRDSIRPGEDPRLPAASPVRPAPDSSSEATTPGYIAHVALDRTSLLVDGREQPIGPGMAITAEIKTGSRRIIDYLLSPLREYAADSFGER
jgi:hemolysin D